MTQTYINTPQGPIDGATITAPSDRTFRSAWNLQGAAIEIDMGQAREIWRDKIRAARNPELEKLDAEFMQALEQGDVSAQSAIAAQKQALRDATGDAGIDAALSAEELKQVQPAGLTIS